MMNLILEPMNHLIFHFINAILYNLYTPTYILFRDQLKLIVYFMF